MGRALVLLALLAWGCTTGAPRAMRHPEFSAAAIRRPAVVLRLAVDETGPSAPGALSARERSALPEAFEIAFLEGLNAEGILPVDSTLSHRPVPRDTRAGASERIQALERARTLGADVLVIVSASVSRLDLIYCRETRGPFVARTTLWRIGVEVLRPADGAALLFEPPGPALSLTDVEPDCEGGRIGRRLTPQELLDETVQRSLSILFRR